MRSPLFERFVETDVLLAALVEALLASLRLLTADADALLFNEASDALALDTLVLKLVAFSSLIEVSRLSLVLPALDALAKSLALAI